MLEPRPIGEQTTPGPDAVMPARHPDALPPGSPLPSHFTGCFGCGPSHPDGLHLRAIAGEGLTLTAALEVTPGHQGAAGLAHGGLLTAAVDEALGALHWLLLTSAVTARLEVNFVAPVPVGSVLELRAAITGCSGRKVYTAAVGTVADRVVLTASGLFIQVGAEHFRRHGRVQAAATADGQEPGASGMDFNP